MLSHSGRFMGAQPSPAPPVSFERAHAKAVTNLTASHGRMFADDREINLLLIDDAPQCAARVAMTNLQDGIDKLALDSDRRYEDAALRFELGMHLAHPARASMTAAKRENGGLRTVRQLPGHPLNRSPN